MMRSQSLHLADGLPDGPPKAPQPTVWHSTALLLGAFPLARPCGLHRVRADPALGVGQDHPQDAAVRLLRPSEAHLVVLDDLLVVLPGYDLGAGLDEIHGRRQHTVHGALVERYDDLQIVVSPRFLESVGMGIHEALGDVRIARYIVHVPPVLLHPLLLLGAELLRRVRLAVQGLPVRGPASVLGPPLRAHLPPILSSSLRGFTVRR